MAKNQKQRLYDDMNDLVDKYPNMWAGDFIVTVDAFTRAMFRTLPPVKKGGRTVMLKHRTHQYRLAA
jgi:hypothetical protein